MRLPKLLLTRVGSSRNTIAVRSASAVTQSRISPCCAPYPKAAFALEARKSQAFSGDALAETLENRGQVRAEFIAQITALLDE
mgnify:CR=1 FL=1